MPAIKGPIYTPAPRCTFPPASTYDEAPYGRLVNSLVPDHAVRDDGGSSAKPWTQATDTIDIRAARTPGRITATEVVPMRRTVWRLC